MKKWIAPIAVFVLLVLLIPFPAQMKDGGTVHYNAIVYDIYDIHRIKPVDNSNEGGTFENAYIEGVIIEIFGIQVFNNTRPHIDN
jgi:hypothetical protein